MLQFLSNAFNDPADPWYYVIGVVFLLLVFGALVVYIIFSGKKNRGGADEPNKEVKPDEELTAQETADSIETPEETRQDKE